MRNPEGGTNRGEEHCGESRKKAASEPVEGTRKTNLVPKGLKA